MVSVVELIAQKRDGLKLKSEDIASLIARYARDEVPNYQMAAMAMAIYFQGLDAEETAAWTKAMLYSGDVLELESLGAGRVDKHSTGGVGDKISIPLAPAVAACGVKVPMVAGRGLGHTGGTVDKLEAIPGYDVAPSMSDFLDILKKHGAAIIGQTEEIAPADKRLYALRDVTGTVESIPLIAASIMSKKLAEGIEGLVLDVKVGPGAFMKTQEDARKLAETMVALGEEMGTKVVAFLTRMDEPLGAMVGNACEIEESLATLSGGGPEDVRELTITLGGAMVELALGVSEAEGRARVTEVLDNGEALARWEAMAEALGGDLKALPKATRRLDVLAPSDGYVQAIDGREVGMVAVQLGAGREKQGDPIDPIVGIEMAAKVGSQVKKGDPLATILLGPERKESPALEARLLGAFTLGTEPPPARPLIIERVG